MKRLLTLMLSLLLATVVAGCTTTAEPGETAPKLDEAQAIDLIWSYEMHLIEAVKDADPTQFVTGLELQWVEERKAKIERNESGLLGWTTGGSTIALTRATEREAEIKVQFADEAGKLHTVTFQLKPVNGEWKFANHTTPDGNWWAPEKKSVE